LQAEPQAHFSGGHAAHAKHRPFPGVDAPVSRFCTLVGAVLRLAADCVSPGKSCGARVKMPRGPGRGLLPSGNPGAVGS
jgi:hypothetical protein